MAFVVAGVPVSSSFLGSRVRICSRSAPPVSLRRLHKASIRMDAVGTGIYSDPTVDPSKIRVVVFGATGYIGRYVAKEFISRGYAVTVFSRSKSGVGGKKGEDDLAKDFPDARRLVFGDVTDLASVSTAFQEDDEAQDWASTVVVSCLASRSGGIADSNLIDYQATSYTLQAARDAGAGHYILLSAICVQKPLLEFQRAKLKFEAELQAAAESDQDFSYSIVRPTAFFKSLAGQIERMKQGSKYVMFGDGKLAKCNAISEADLARFIANCAIEPEKRNAILPVGGPGEPVTPIEQAQTAFKILGKEPKYQTAPIGLMDVVINTLGALGTVIPPLKEAAEFGRIGKYYATEDMVGPSFGEDTLEDFFKQVAEKGMQGQELGEASIFK